MELRTKDLGLASFMRIKGVRFIGFDGIFVFESDKNENEWRVEWMESECYQYDKELIAMKKFLYKEK